MQPHVGPSRSPLGRRRGADPHRRRRATTVRPTRMCQARPTRALYSGSRPGWGRQQRQTVPGGRSRRRRRRPRCRERCRQDRRCRYRRLQLHPDRTRVPPRRVPCPAGRRLGRSRAGRTMNRPRFHSRRPGRIRRRCHSPRHRHPTLTSRRWRRRHRRRPARRARQRQLVSYWARRPWRRSATAAGRRQVRAGRPALLLTAR